MEGADFERAVQEKPREKKPKSEEPGAMSVVRSAAKIPSDCFVEPPSEAGTKYKCTLSSSYAPDRDSRDAIGGRHRVVILSVKGVGVEDVSLTGNTVQIRFNPPISGREKGRTPSIDIDSGSYHSQEAVAFPLDGRNQWTKMTLRPLCAQRRVVVPQYECVTVDQEGSRSVEIGFESSEQTEYLGASRCRQTGSSLEYQCAIPISKTGATSVTASACKKTVTFKARLDPPLPPDPIELLPAKFMLSWVPNCLSSQESCPVVSAASGGLNCPAEPDRPDWLKGALHDSGEKRCTYRCTSDRGAHLPTTLRLHPKNESVNQYWDEVLTFPGQILRGFIPAEQRRISLNWNWPETDRRIGDLPDQEVKGRKPGDCAECRSKVENEASKDCPAQRELRLNLKLSSYGRDACLKKFEACGRCPAELRNNLAKRTGSEIDYLEIRTPEGRIHNVGVDATQIRVPELECSDQVALTYKGRLSYRQEHKPYEANAEGVEVPSPDASRKQKVLFSAAIGGGVQWLPYHEQGGFAPAGEVDGIVVLTPIGYSVWGIWKLDVRSGLLLAGRPYCYQLGGEGTPCQDSHGLFPYWRVVVEDGLTVYWPSGLRFEASAGFGHSFYFYERDSNKFQHGTWSGFLATGRMAFGYELVRGVTVSIQGRASYPEPIYGTTFGDAGVVRHGPIDGNRWSLNPLGIMLRFDDIL
jgi:hypothetical protein